MTTPVELTPRLMLAVGAQGLLLLLGLLVLWRVQFSPRSGPLRQDRLPPWPIRPLDFGLAGVVVVLGGLFGQVALGALLVQLLGPADPDFQVIIAGAAFQAGLLFSGLLVLRMNRATLPAPDPAALAPRAGPIAAAGAVTLLAALPILTGINLLWLLLLESLGWSTDSQELVDLFARAESPAVVITLTFLAVVVAPLAEELIFRAGLFRFLRHRLPRPVALLGSAVIFGLLHGNLVAFAPLVGLGIIFALAYERTGRIAVPIVAHGLFNLNTILLLLAGVQV